MITYEVWMGATNERNVSYAFEKIGRVSEYVNAWSDEGGRRWRGGFTNYSDMEFTVESVSKSCRDVLFVMWMKDHGSCAQSVLYAYNGKTEHCYAYMPEFPEPSDELLGDYDGGIPV